MSNKTKIVEKNVFVDLTQDEILECGKLAGQAQAQLDGVIKEFDTAQKKYTKLTSELNVSIDGLLASIHNGKDVRVRTCVEEYDTSTQKIKTWLEGKLIAERQMTDEDIQEHLPLETVTEAIPEHKTAGIMIDVAEVPAPIEKIQTPKIEETKAPKRKRASPKSSPSSKKAPSLPDPGTKPAPKPSGPGDRGYPLDEVLDESNEDDDLSPL